MPDFTLTTLEPAPFAYLTRVSAMRDVGRTVSETFAELSGAFATANATPQGAPLAHFRPAENDNVCVDLGFPVLDGALDALERAGLAVGETPHGRVMRTQHVGGYDTLGQTYDALLAEMRAKGLTPAADMWERYGGAGDDVQVEVIWPIVG